MSPNDPEPIFLIILYLLPTMKSDLLTNPMIDMAAAVAVPYDTEKKTQLPRTPLLLAYARQ
jgi:hypothetical protein